MRRERSGYGKKRVASLRVRLARKPPGYRFTIGRVLAIYGAIMVALLLAALDQTIVATALPHIVADIGGLESYSWVITAYVLAMAVTVPLYGKLGDIHGRRLLYIFAISIFLFGSVLCGLSQSMGQLVAARAVQGTGAGGLFALAIATVGVIVPPRDRGRYQGLIGATFAAGSIIGPALGGLIVDHTTWRWVFYVNLPVGAVALAVIAIAIPKRTQRREHSLDLLGATLLAIATSSFLVGLVWGGETHPWSFDAGARSVRHRPRLGDGVRVRRAEGEGADPAVRVPAQPDRRRRRGLGRPVGDGDGRDDRVRPALRSRGDRHLGHLLGRRPHAVHARGRDRERDLRPVDLAERPLPAERARGAGRPGQSGSSCSPGWTRRPRTRRRLATWSSRASGSG